MEYKLTLRYTEPMVRDAVWQFMRRRVLGRWQLWVLPAVLGAFAVENARSHGAELWTGAALAGAFAVVALAGIVWRAHWMNSVGKVRRMSPPEAEASLDEYGFALQSNLGKTVIPWSSFVEVWACDGYWMLFMAQQSFLTIPMQDVSAEVREFLRAKLSAAKYGKGRC